MEGQLDMHHVLAATPGTIDVDTFLWVIGIVFGIIGTLILTVCWFYYNLVQKLEERVVSLDNRINTEVQKNDTRYDVVTKKIEDEAKERIDKHTAFADRTFAEIDKVKDKTGDISETIAGFGSIYVTRNEFSSHRKGG